MDIFHDETLLNMDNGNICGAVFLDLTKAFDTVDHEIMMNKLSTVEVSESSLAWFFLIVLEQSQGTHPLWE